MKIPSLSKEKFHSRKRYNANEEEEFCYLHPVPATSGRARECSPFNTVSTLAPMNFNSVVNNICSELFRWSARFKRSTAAAAAACPVLFHFEIYFNALSSFPGRKKESRFLERGRIKAGHSVPLIQKTEEKKKEMNSNVYKSHLIGENRIIWSETE